MFDELEESFPGVKDSIPVDKRRRKHASGDRTPKEQLGPELLRVNKKIPRVCLRCDKGFKAETELLRLCVPCRKYATSLNLPGYEGW